MVSGYGINIIQMVSRKFNGPLNPRDEKLHEGFLGLEMNEYENMQKKHLHAYLMGDEYFKYKGQWYKVEAEVVNE